MIEKGVLEEKAQNHKINEEILGNRFSRVIVNLSKNMARTAQCIYQHGDGVGTSTGVTKDCIAYSNIDHQYLLSFLVFQFEWRELNVKKKLSFSRGRVMEIYLLATDLSFEAQYAKCRICFTKYACLATVVDDIYDIYGSLDELQCFTKVVTNPTDHERPWLSRFTLNQRTVLEGWFFFVLWRQTLLLISFQLISMISLISLLVEIKRGDIPKVGQSYMIEKRISEGKARNHVKELINYAWKKINEEILETCFPQVIMNLSKNMTQAAQSIYHMVMVLAHQLVSLKIYQLPLPH
ncbi:hypothetical protein CXB51_010949 [Gossypium anomalum]|uniref:Terpene synthase metal-binding domain-containing protein n=1 Tax=Gossypium anomalum TaxID=47600 RepID=A0A8J6D4K7_9ROSI|nr:hypothetical protein CXB51_010949 [Gossypium anomalum]